MVGSMQNIACPNFILNTIVAEELGSFADILSKTEHLYCGISSGAVLYAGFNIAESLINKNIVVILPDDENRYSYNKENI